MSRNKTNNLNSNSNNNPNLFIINTSTNNNNNSKGSSITKNNTYKRVYEEILSEYSTAKLLAISKQQYSNDNTMNNLGQPSISGSCTGTIPGPTTRTNHYPHSQNSSTIRNSNLYETYNLHNEPLSSNNNIVNYSYYNSNFNSNTNTNSNNSNNNNNGG